MPEPYAEAFLASLQGLHPLTEEACAALLPLLSPIALTRQENLLRESVGPQRG